MQYAFNHRSVFLYVVGSILVLLAAACTDPSDVSAPSPGNVDSATNWLQACDSDSICEGSAICASGVCSLRCESSIEFGSVGNCSEISATAECISTDQDMGRCDQRCTDSTSCAGLGTQYGCLGGFCRRNAAEQATAADAGQRPSPVDGGQLVNGPGNVEDVTGAYAFRVVATLAAGPDAGAPLPLANATSYGVSTVSRNSEGEILASEALCYSAQGDTLAHLQVIGSWSPDALRRMPMTTRGLTVEADGALYGSPAKRWFALQEGIEAPPEDPNDEAITDPDQDGRPGIAIRWLPPDGGAECRSDLIGVSSGRYTDGRVGEGGKLQRARLAVEREDFRMFGADMPRCAYPMPPIAARTHEVTFAPITGIAGDVDPPACPTLDEMIQLF